MLDRRSQLVRHMHIKLRPIKVSEIYNTTLFLCLIKKCYPFADMVCFGYTVKLSLSTHDRQRTPQNRTRFQDIAIKRFSFGICKATIEDRWVLRARNSWQRRKSQIPVSHPSLKNFNLRCQFNFGMTGKTLLIDVKEKASLEDFFIYF